LQAEGEYCEKNQDIHGGVVPCKARILGDAAQV
jgi:hypothetical protein